MDDRLDWDEIGRRLAASFRAPENNKSSEADSAEIKKLWAARYWRSKFACEISALGKHAYSVFKACFLLKL